MKKSILNILLLLFSIHLFAQTEDISLLIRADDIGSFHAANLACIDTYQKGMVLAVELSADFAWFR